MTVTENIALHGVKEKNAKRTVPRNQTEIQDCVFDKQKYRDRRVEINADSHW